MWILRTWQLGTKSLFLHPMRSLLTILGIFIGVASVIWLLAIGEGISQEAQRQIESLGAKNIMVRSVKPTSESTANVRVVSYGLTRHDYDKLVQTIPSLEDALPIREIRREFRYGDRSVDGRLVGCTPDYAEVTQLHVDRGRFISDADIKGAHNYCVLAARVAELLFPYENPIGRSIYLIEHRNYYRVIGVMQTRNPTAAIGGSLEAQDFSNDVYIPISTLRGRIGDMVTTRRSGSFESEKLELNQITLRVRDVKDVERTADLVKLSLASHEKMRDVAVIVPLELLEQAQTTRLMFMIFMGLIAAISLVVGGIGIMNIMLATVTERTREIGIRRALGARRGDIVRQFLVETIVLSIGGGLTGIAGGLICPFVLTWTRTLAQTYFPRVMAQLPEAIRNMEPTVVPLSIPLAFGISVVVGVVFGIYPAIRAAKMNPIEALRHT